MLLRPRPSRLRTTVAPGLRWLDAASSQSPVGTARGPRLHPGLHKLDVTDDWLRVEPDRYALDMRLKEKAFAEERDDVLVATEDEAERETHELVVEFLTRKHADKFARTAGGVAVSMDGYERVVASRPSLEAAARLAQEDLFVLRREGESVRLVSTACCFSFARAGARARARHSLDELHAKVGGYDDDLAGPVSRAFRRLAHPVWRANWSISLSDDLRPRPGRDFLNPEKQKRLFDATTPADYALARVERRGVEATFFCKTEYQTLRTLETPGAILFTVHTYVEPFCRLTPAAAASLAANVQNAQRHKIKLYKNLGDPRLVDMLLGFLHERAASS